MTHHRIIILGAGTAGLSAWKQATDLTDDVLMIDPGPLGTTCARVGCMPSKALVQLALDAEAGHSLYRKNLLSGSPGQIDGAAAMAEVRRLRDHFVAGPIAATRKMGERFINSAARFTGPDSIEADGRTLSADAFIVAVGTKPFVPPGWPDLGDRLVTSDDVFELTDIPARIGVIGTGAIGCEIGQSFAMLGAEVHMFGHGEKLAGIVDEDINREMHSALSEHLTLHTNMNVEPVATDIGVEIVSASQRTAVDLVVAATGRRAVVDAMGLENLGVPLNERGLPDIDPVSLRAGSAPVWFAGDISNIRPLMHEAADEGRLAAWHALHPDAECLARRTPMGIVFTRPQAAWAGLRRNELPADALTGEADFGRQGRATLMGHKHGLMKVFADAHGVLIGAEMACAGAEHMAHELAWLIQQRVHVVDALQLPFYHPVLEEGLRTALHGIRRQLPERERRPDLPLCRDFDQSMPGT